MTPARGPAATRRCFWSTCLNATLVAGAVLLISLLVTACGRSPSPVGADPPELRPAGSEVLGHRPTATASQEPTPSALAAEALAATLGDESVPSPANVSDAYARVVAALVVLLVLAMLARWFLELVAAAMRWVAAVTGTVLLVVLVGYVLAT
jgi:hypothetical protein